MTEEDDFRLIGAAPDPGPCRGALALLEDAEGRVLLHLRDDREGVIHQGRWSLFGGAVEEGETLAQAVRREVREELSIDLPEETFDPFAWVQSDSPRRSRLFIFTARTDLTPDRITLREGAGFGFFSESQAASLAFADPLKPVLTAYFFQKAQI